MSWSDGCLGRENRFYSIGVFDEEEEEASGMGGLVLLHRKKFLGQLINDDMECSPTPEALSLSHTHTQTDRQI